MSTELIKKEKEKAQLEKEIEEELYEPIDYLEPKAQKYALKQVTTTLSKGKIANSLGISDYKRRQLEKNKHFKKYKSQLQKRFGDKEIVATERRQMRYIREQMFLELASRFDDPQQAMEEHFGTDEHGLIDATKDEKEKFKDRFAKYAPFKDLVNALKKIDKMRRLDEGQATENIDDSALENRARKRYQELKERKQKKTFHDEKSDEALKEGIDTWDEYKAKVIDAEYEEVNEDKDNQEQEQSSSTKDEENDDIMSEFEINNGEE